MILIGETGSGKTTQIPQFLQECGLNRQGKCIGITQPRRVAAISLAQRVGLERGQTSQVGFRVRFEDSTNSETKIIYQTDGMLLREAMLDPILSKYSWIILGSFKFFKIALHQFLVILLPWYRFFKSLVFFKK